MKSPFIMRRKTRSSSMERKSSGARANGARCEEMESKEKLKLNLHHFQLSRKNHLTAQHEKINLIFHNFFLSHFSIFLISRRDLICPTGDCRLGGEGVVCGGTSSAAVRKQSFRRKFSRFSRGSSEDPIER